MLTRGEKEILVGKIVRSSYEAITLEDLGSQILPLIDCLLDASTSLLYRFDDQREMIGVAGTLAEAHKYYAQHYMSHDPMQPVQRHQEPWILHGPRCREWKGWIDHPVHAEFATYHGVDNYLSIRLNDYDMHVPGQVGIILARTSRQPDFSDREQLVLSNILPALETLTRRSEKWEGQVRIQSFLESMLDFSPHPMIVLDPRGSFVWASERAEVLLPMGPRGCKQIPDALVKAARDLGALTGKNPSPVVPPASVTVSRKNANPIRADLRLARNRNGVYFVIAELTDPRVSPTLSDTAVRHQLTKTETQVLYLISSGLSDREIGQRLFVSLATVHTHVVRILDKLGVRSRVQAALVAHGLKPEVDPDDE